MSYFIPPIDSSAVVSASVSVDTSDSSSSKGLTHKGTVEDITK